MKRWEGVASVPGVMVLATLRRSHGLVAMIDGVQPHRYCEREGVPASAVPLLRGEWRLGAAGEGSTNDGTEAAQ